MILWWQEMILKKSPCWRFILPRGLRLRENYDSSWESNLLDQIRASSFLKESISFIYFHTYRDWNVGMQTYWFSYGNQPSPQRLYRWASGQREISKISWEVDFSLPYSSKHSYLVNVVSQFMHNPCSPHLNIEYRILRYLKSALEKGLLFSNNCHLMMEVLIEVD